MRKHDERNTITIPKDADVYPCPEKVYRRALALEKEAGGKDVDGWWLAERLYFELLGRAHGYDAGFFEDAAFMKEVMLALQARTYGLRIRPERKKEKPAPGR